MSIRRKEWASRTPAEVARLASAALHRWYGFPRLDRRQLAALTRKIKKLVFRTHFDQAVSAIQSPEANRLARSFERHRAALRRIARDQSEVARQARSLLEPHDRHLLDFVVGLPRKHRTPPGDTPDWLLAQRPLADRTILVGKKLPKLYSKTYPRRPFESGKVKSTSLACADRSRWGPGPLFIAIILRCLGFEPPKDGEEFRKYTQRVERNGGDKKR